MQAWLRKLTSLIAFLTLVSAGACKQEKSPTDGQSSATSIGGGADQSVLAEAIVILLFIARKQAQDAGECVQDEHPGQTLAYFIALGLGETAKIAH